MMSNPQFQEVREAFKLARRLQLLRGAHAVAHYVEFEAPDADPRAAGAALLADVALYLEELGERRAA